MSTVQASDLFAKRFEEMKSKNIAVTTVAKGRTTPGKPTVSSWEELKAWFIEKDLVNFLGTWKRAKDLYDLGFGAELKETGEIALERAKHPRNYFATMISIASGNWPRTLRTVHDTWNVRRLAHEVMEKLKLDIKSTKAIFALAWRLKGSIQRFLGVATEQGTGIKNPAAVFFALTNKKAT